jgi:predicted amino acid dehydrogenase
MEEIDANSFITVSTDLHTLRCCDIVICASNAAGAVLLPEQIKSETRLICDIAVAADVSKAFQNEPRDIIIFQGGILRLPHVTEDICGDQLPAGKVFACVGETLLLGWAQIDRSLSMGRIEPPNVYKALELAKIHGLEADIPM